MKANSKLKGLQTLAQFLSDLRGVPARSQRQALEPLAKAALPQEQVATLFLAVGCGGELTAAGAALSMMSQLMPGATLRLYDVPEPEGDGRRVDAVIEDGGFAGGAYGRHSPGLAIVLAVIEALIRKAGQKP